MSIFASADHKCFERIAIALERLVELQEARMGIRGAHSEADIDDTWFGYTEDFREVEKELAEEERIRLGLSEGLV